MISIDKLVEIGFTLPQATDISAYLSNAGYIGDFAASDVVTGYSIPENKVIVISSIDSLNSIFKAGTKYYADIETILMQKNNTSPNQGRVNQVIIFQKSDEDSMADAFDALMAINANFLSFMFLPIQKLIFLRLQQKLKFRDVCSLHRQQILMSQQELQKMLQKALQIKILPIQSLFSMQIWKV